MNPRTEQNLVTSMHDEAFTHAKYLLFAEQARRNSRPLLADLFEKIANVELHKHFAGQAHLAGLVQSDSENLSEALSGESQEINHIYRRFASEAEADGEDAASRLFSELREDEIGHRDAFAAALKDLSLAEW